MCENNRIDFVYKELLAKIEELENRINEQDAEIKNLEYAIRGFNFMAGMEKEGF